MLIPLVVVIVFFGIAGALYYFDQKNKSMISPEGAGIKIIDFINKNLLQGQTTATLNAVFEESGVYKILFEVENQEYTFYTTRDGKLLFTSGGPMPEEEPGETEPAPVTGIPQRDVSQALLFVMSYCPYGNQAEEIMMPVFDLLGNRADIRVHYVIYSNYGGGGPNYCLDKDNKYCSMHGIQELNQNVREICVQKYQKDKFWTFLKEMNSKCNYQNADSCWEGVAKSIGLDADKIKTCQKNESIALLEQEVQLNKKYGITGSPQLVINDAEYSGARSAEAYKSAICAGFNDAPAECSQSLGDAGAAVPAGGCE